MKVGFAQGFVIVGIVSVAGFIPRQPGQLGRFRGCVWHDLRNAYRAFGAGDDCAGFIKLPATGLRAQQNIKRPVTVAGIHHRIQLTDHIPPHIQGRALFLLIGDQFVSLQHVVAVHVWTKLLQNARGAGVVALGNAGLDGLIQRAGYVPLGIRCAYFFAAVFQIAQILAGLLDAADGGF